MPLEIEINGSTSAAARYVSFAPSPCRIRQNPPGAAALTVTIGGRRATPTGGEIVFYLDPALPSEETLTLDVPANGDWVEFFTGGRWEHASCDDRDCLLVADSNEGEHTVALMVRVRKNANTLKCRERDRFLNAFKLLNNAGNGVFQDFRNMHVNPADGEEHRGSQFLPWHRAFLLDLERQLQAIDPAVALHYWRFDEPAPNVLDHGFVGATSQVPEGAVGQAVVLPAGHPLAGWVTDGTPGIVRAAYFDTQTSPALGLASFPLRTQAQTLALGDQYAQFRIMEGSPHGAAHVSFGGSISSINTAAKDPLFFMLHSNIDRLWALWQWQEDRMDANAAASYVPQNRDGRRVADTLWPWNDVTTPPRPPFAPRGTIGFTASDSTPAPGAMPTVGGMVDSQGHLATANRLGFGYDDVPFETPGGTP